MAEHTDEVVRHCQEIDRCNQRGGRMLSVVDLIEAGTFTPELAAYCLAAIRQGSSFMIGALPGGAGKTTVMGALLNFVPADAELVAADSEEAVCQAIGEPSPPRCFICHEIGPGPYYAYLWGEKLRQYFRLAEAGHTLATNLHADTYEQAYDQICRVNQVPEAALRQMNLMLFLSVGRGGRRWIGRVWESDGRQPHRIIFEAGNAGLNMPSLLASESGLASARQATDRLLSSGRRTIEAVRAMILEVGKA